MRKSNKTKKRTVKKSISKQWVSPIPKKVHLIWIGGDPPEYFKLFLQTFFDHLPEFDIKVWGNKDLTRKKFSKNI